jgi:hypothetical protein
MELMWPAAETTSDNSGFGEAAGTSGIEFAGNYLQQGRFAGAIGTKQGQAVAGAHVKRDAGKQKAFAEGFGDIRQSQHVRVPQRDKIV